MISAFAPSSSDSFRTLVAHELVAPQDTFLCPKTSKYVAVPLCDIGKKAQDLRYSVYRMVSA